VDKEMLTTWITKKKANQRHVHLEVWN
jgi:hypothetical protein